MSVLSGEAHFIKIDFGKKAYRQADIDRWNQLKLPRSIALCPDEPRFRDTHIHNRVLVTEWGDDGSRQFQLSIRRFDIISWLNNGTIRCTLPYRLLQFLLMDKFFKSRCSDLIRRMSGRPLLSPA